MSGLVPQRDRDAVVAFRQGAVRHQREEAAGEGVFPIRKTRLDVETANAVIGIRHRPPVDRDLDRRDARPSQCPAADFEIAAQRHPHRSADQARGVEVQFAFGIAGDAA